MSTKVSRENLKICQFGEKCYRKNPIHFGEFAHPHLDKIYDIGPDPITKKYPIPVGLDEETVTQQLKLLEKLFPKRSTSPTSKTTQTSTGKNKAKANTINCDKRSLDPTQELTPSTSRSSASSAENESKLIKKQKISKDIHQYIPVVVEKGLMADKLKLAAPYNFFLTTITDCKLTHNEPLSITLQEILDESLGKIESSVQINFMVDVGWLLGHYYFAGILGTPLLLLYGDETPELKTISQHQPQVKAIKVQMSTPFSTSHSKIMIFGYKGGSMRIVISTANLYEDDWHNRTQGIWISPLLPALPEDADTVDGESPTNFKQDFMLYLVEYKLPELQPWLARIRRCDFSDINVFFIASVPGGFQEGPRGHPWGHARLGGLLQKYIDRIDDSVPIVCQSSSIGSLGPSVQGWVQQDFLKSLRRDKKSGLRSMPSFQMIYPSLGNVSGSHDGLLGGGCLPYSKQTKSKQPWLHAHMSQWRSSMRHRSKAMPHIKTYTRFNLNERCCYWFVLTSANLSRAAWGTFNKNTKLQPCLRISNYEAGVLFLPEFVLGEDTFPLGYTRDGKPPFPLPYDVPLTPYEPADTPFVMDYLQ